MKYLTFFSLSFFSCYFGVLKGADFFQMLAFIHLCVLAGNSWAKSMRNFVSAVFFVRKKGPHMKAVLASWLVLHMGSSCSLSHLIVSV